MIQSSDLAASSRMAQNDQNNNHIILRMFGLSLMIESKTRFRKIGLSTVKSFDMNDNLRSRNDIHIISINENWSCMYIEYQSLTNNESQQTYRGID